MVTSMGSRLRENPDKLFEVFVEVAKPEGDQDPFIVEKFPPEYDNEEVLKTIPKFVYPCQMECSIVEHFTFTMTDLESMFSFGFCRYASGTQTCLCIISFLPWFEVFYKLLNMLAEVTNRSENNSAIPLLKAMYHQDIPMPNVPVTIVAQQDMFSFTATDPNQLPSIPNSRNLTEYYNAVDMHNMMIVFASMLNERRVVFTSKKLSRLTACIHAAEALLYPMHWQHLLIPVLPANLIDYLSAPMPYVIGVHTSLICKIRNMELGDAVIVDTDKNVVKTEYDDLEDLPEEVVSYLKKNLKNERLKASMQNSGDAISKIFLEALVRLIGGYREALKFSIGEPITFMPEVFVTTRPPSMRPFLENMLHLQIFQQFINGRLDILNCGQGFTDLFEKMAILHTDKLNTQSRYKEWLGNMKKQQKKFSKGGKVVWSDFKEKAPIMMTTAVQSVKTHGKKAVTGIKTRFHEINESGKHSSKMPTPSTSTKTFNRQQRPATIVGSKLEMSRPPRPPPPGGKVARSQSSRMIPQSTKYSTINITTEDLSRFESFDDNCLPDEYQRVSVNLMTDPDIQSALHRSASDNNLNPKTVWIADSDSSSSTDHSGNVTPGVSSTSIPYLGITDTGSTEHMTEQLINVSKTMEESDLPPAILPRQPLQNLLAHDLTAPLRPPKPRTKEKELIKFDSTESESDMFDPLKQKVVDLQQRQPQASGLERGLSNRGSVISRSPAFRKPQEETPKRATYRPDHESSPETNFDEQSTSSFDPLAGFDKRLYPGFPPAAQATDDKMFKHDNDSLLHDWTLGHLAGSRTSPVTVPPPRPSPPLHCGKISPVPSGTLPMDLATRPVPKPRNSIGNKFESVPMFQNPNQSNFQTRGGPSPQLGTSSQTSSSDPFGALLQPSFHSSNMGGGSKLAPEPTGQVRQKSDPFEDLMGLTLNPPVSKPQPSDSHRSTSAKSSTFYAPKPKWQTFD
ncbi:DENN domain-containing protein 1A-like isoform X2 [Gigantopelta aegis]|uniref:DENN domain-containing protein 1A-like isoform X2 n=1 Tax=Gigantopelta aegis TaxID=1735272 RepID=UPI001B88D663|nr:DENN domain-containing protein 1A-like isoform X2 [Gigantopelta aegis]